MRMRKKKNRDLRLASCGDLVVAKPCPDKWTELFENDHPIFLEIGCGKGKFIAQTALQNPQNNYVAIELSKDVLVIAAENAPDIKNLRFISCDARLLSEHFATGEISGIFLNFSDPWPKKRHAKRRLTHQSFLNIYKQVIKPGGTLAFKTDNCALFDFSLAQFDGFGLALSDVTYDLHSSNFQGNVMTEYETRFHGLGMPIHRVVARF